MSHIKYKYHLKVKIDGRGLSVHVCYITTNMAIKILKILLLFLILWPTTLEAGTEPVRLHYDIHSKGAASKAEGGDLLTRMEALKKEAKKDYRLIDSLIDDEVPTSAAVLREKLAQHQKDLNQLRGL